MTDWFERYMKVNLTARLTMIASVVMSWRCAEWFMNLGRPHHRSECFLFRHHGCHDWRLWIVSGQGSQRR